MYILQQSLFSFEELLEIETKDRLPLFFSVLDLRPYAKELKSASPQGARGHERQAILRALLVAPLEGISKFTALHRRLKSDIQFRYQCGFNLTKNVPSIATLSRAFKALVEKKLFEKLFIELVELCKKEGIIDGRKLAIDSTAINAYEKKQPKSKCKDSQNANWGAKNDTFGNKITWFGYKIHLAVDTESELPVALEVTPANIADCDIGPLVLNEAASNLKVSKIDFSICDAGYDQNKNYEAAKKLGGQAIIPLNLRNEKEPPAGFTTNGTPHCSMGYEMAYWGCDGKYLKFRCPHVLGKVDCPQGSNWCSSSNYGLVIKVNSEDDLRRFSTPHRGSKRWEEIYDERTCVERCNSRLKETLTANDLHVRGINKVKAYAYLNAIVLLVSALGINNAKKNTKIAA